MALFTSYLGFLNSKRARERYARWYRVGCDSFSSLALLCTEKGKEKVIDVLFIMRNRGNNEVAPTAYLLKMAKNGEVNWDEYRQRYLDWIGRKGAVEWMKKVGERAKEHDVVLVCYCGPRFGKHCHRFLLAESVSKWSGAEYKGELEA